MRRRLGAALRRDSRRRVGRATTYSWKRVLEVARRAGRRRTAARRWSRSRRTAARGSPSAVQAIVARASRCCAAIAPSLADATAPASAPSPLHDQVLRNQSCGSRCSVRRLGPAVVDRDPHQDVVGRGLGVLDEDVEVAVVVEDAGVEQLELRLVACRGGGSPRPAARRGTRAADTCRASSGRSASAWRRGSSRTP